MNAFYIRPNMNLLFLDEKYSNSTSMNSIRLRFKNCGYYPNGSL